MPQLLPSVCVLTQTGWLVVPQRVVLPVLVLPAQLAVQLNIMLFVVHVGAPPGGIGGHMTHVPGAGPHCRVPDGQGWHFPAVHMAPIAHCMPQPPQLFGSDCRFTHVLPQRFGVAGLSHRPAHIVPLQATSPFIGAAGQLAHIPGLAPHCSVPVGQGWHFPAVHVAPVGHWVPQAPQLFGSVCLFTHALPQRSGRFDMLQAWTQELPLHAVVPFVGAAGHMAHVLLQFCVPAGQLLQAPAEQPAGQPWPHAPQFFGSVARLASHPFEARPSQLPKPMAQKGLEQTEATHVSVPPLMLQAAPHLPQLFGSVEVFTSQPFAAL